MSDTTKVGDSFYTNAMLDNVLVSPDGFCDAGAKVYAARCAVCHGDQLQGVSLEQAAAGERQVGVVVEAGPNDQQ